MLDDDLACQYSHKEAVMIRRTREDLDGAVCLVVQGDDLGMCHAVNDGILSAYTEGILTQTTAMAPCPWWSEGVEMAVASGLAIGMHSTLTCEWDRVRWRPLTAGQSLMTKDLGFHPTVDAARQAADADEAVAELLAQWRLFEQASCPVTHVDHHMGSVCLPAYEAVCQVSGLPYLYRDLDHHLQLASWALMSDRDDKVNWLTDYLRKLAPGYHLLVVHPGVDHPELANMASETNPVRRWAAEYRLSDLRTLCEPEVVKTIDDLDIQLVSLRDVPVTG